MRLAGESACPTTGQSLACIGGTGFSLSMPAGGRIFSHLLTVGALACTLGATRWDRPSHFVVCWRHLKTRMLTGDKWRSPVPPLLLCRLQPGTRRADRTRYKMYGSRSEEHTSELQ